MTPTVPVEVRSKTSFPRTREVSHHAIPSFQSRQRQRDWYPFAQLRKVPLTGRTTAAFRTAAKSASHNRARQHGVKRDTKLTLLAVLNTLAMLAMLATLAVFDYWVSGLTLC